MTISTILTKIKAKEVVIVDKFNILRVKAENIGFFENKIFDIDFTNQMQITNFDEDHPYYNVGSSVYLPKVAVFKGVNASGKTSTLETLEVFILLYLHRLPLRHALFTDFQKKAFKNDEVKLTLFFELRGIIYKIDTTIKTVRAYALNEDIFTGKSTRCIISEEKIYKKTLRQSTKKSSLYDEGFTLLIDRAKLKGEQKTFLKDDESIISILDKRPPQWFITQIERTNEEGVNFLLRYNEDTNAFDTEIIQFLDPSIKKIMRKQIKNVDSQYLSISEPSIALYEVAFKNGETYELTRAQLIATLSAGTLYGLQILARVKDVLKTGGLYLVDELELHLNKSIVSDIIKLFNDPDTNPHNATLIFSTHYTEILDLFGRNDQIFIVHRNDKYEIKISNYSNYDKKNQLKKSDAYFADSYGLGTAVSYDTYLEFIKFFRKLHAAD